MITPTNKPTLVQWANLSFVIMDAPTNDNLQFYLKELKRYNVTDLVRACEITYDREAVNAAGIKVHELEFPDGEPPDDVIFQRWLSLVADRFKENQASPTMTNRSIAVHCVAGLGRAPVLVAIALIENGVDPITAVEHIRKFRRGAINLRQLKYLEKYEPHFGQKQKCTIM
uniref:Protein tyrosine phosphatase type IVA protein 1 put n=1 Tax=Albugo laibachii Nc14 TaxID=890382 RepID=F0WBD9_9STRA|nr:protein tyrosine phosphatase type IVA protein 1 put [Albugo laibachii Nc14]|eukprot:CCA18463.1 protein tyrosine phosphatase type IVA protein 1 put [Albugo laibachii Nc14]